MEFQVRIKIMICLFLLFQVFATVHSGCQPPDKPEGGSYKPENSKYLPGDRVIYTCRDKLTRIGKEIRTCQASGMWSGLTPFCDSPTKLRSPSATSDPHNEIRNVVDLNPNTCYRSKNGTGQNLKVFLDSPAAINVIRLYLQKGRAHFKISSVQGAYGGRTEVAQCATYERDIEEDQWVTFECKNSDVQADYLSIQDQSDRGNILGVCEVEAYVKDDIWCKNPPNYFVPNGRLEVSHDKATLQCAEGYKAKENTRLLCERNVWGLPNLQCDEILCEPIVGNSTLSNGEWYVLDLTARKLSVGIKRQLKCNKGFKIIGKPDFVTCTKFGVWTHTTATCTASEPEKKESFKIIAIAVGSVVALIILILLGVMVFIIHKKKAREVVVIYKPDEYAYPAPSASSDAEYSAVYYDAIHKSPPYPPTPSRPPHLRPNLGEGYSKPVDNCSPSSTLNKQPADIAFGTLKSSCLYDTLQ